MSKKRITAKQCTIKYQLIRNHMNTNATSVTLSREFIDTFTKIIFGEK